LLEAAYAEAAKGGTAPADRMNLDPDRSLLGSVVQMWARYLIETRSWNSDVADWSFKSGDAFDPNLTISFVRALQAAFAGQVAQAGQYHEQFRALQASLGEEIAQQEEKAPADLLFLERLRVMDQELLAAIEMARGEMGRAADLAREASRLEGDMPFSFGPPFVDLPAAEFLGDLLAAARRPAEAAQAYEQQLERTRLKPRALEGLARAQEQLGQQAEARYTRSRLDQIRRAADGHPAEALP
jgi:hypothetical protein